MLELLQPYNSQWATAFQLLQAGLSQGLQISSVDIIHVGSTAIPGLPAKPILDIDVIIPHEDRLPRLESLLVAMGYLSRGNQGIPGRYAFRQQDLSVPRIPGLPGQAWMPHHLYVCMADSLALKNHLCFRDALLADPDLAAAYGRLKWALVHELGMDRERYTKAKTDFVLQVLEACGFSADELSQIAAANR